MAIDWLSTGSMLTGIGSLAGAGAIVGAAVVGRGALSDYRKQRITDKEIDAAEMALTAAYRAEEAVEGMRGRWMPAAELEATEEQLKELGMKLDGMPDAEKSAYVQRGVIYRRAEFFKSDFDAVFEVIPIARAYFDQAVVDALKQFPKARNRILTSSDMLPLVTGDDARENKELYQDIRRDVFGAWKEGDEDKVGDMAKEAISTLEQKLLQVIRPENANA